MRSFPHFLYLIVLGCSVVSAQPGEPEPASWTSMVRNSALWKAMFGEPLPKIYLYKAPRLKTTPRHKYLTGKLIAKGELRIYEPDNFLEYLECYQKAGTDELARSEEEDAKAKEFDTIMKALEEDLARVVIDDAEYRSHAKDKMRATTKNRKSDGAWRVYFIVQLLLWRDSSDISKHESLLPTLHLSSSDSDLHETMLKAFRKYCPANRGDQVDFSAQFQMCLDFKIRCAPFFIDALQMALQMFNLPVPDKGFGDWDIYFKRPGTKLFKGIGPRWWTYDQRRGYESYPSPDLVPWNVPAKDEDAERAKRIFQIRRMKGMET